MEETYNFSFWASVGMRIREIQLNVMRLKSREMKSREKRLSKAISMIYRGRGAVGWRQGGGNNSDKKYLN